MCEFHACWRTTFYNPIKRHNFDYNLLFITITREGVSLTLLHVGFYVRSVSYILSYGPFSM